MIHDISLKISECLCELQQIEEHSKKEEAAYGIEMIISTVFSAAAAISISAITHYFKECLMFLIVFMPLRMFTGGYHAPTHMQCFLTLMGDLVIGFILLHITSALQPIFSLMLIIVSVIIVSIFAPIADINHPMSKRQIRLSRKRSLQIAVFAAIEGICLILQGLQNLYFSVSYALISVAMSIIAVKINFIRRKNSET